MDRVAEVSTKQQRLWQWLTDQGLQGALIGKRSNFAWITAGGDNHIFWASDAGAASLLVLPEGMHLIAHTMDGERMMEEELHGLGIKLSAYRWHQNRHQILMELVRGRRIGSDAPVAGMHCLGNWGEVVFPLLPPEIERAREVSRLADEVLTEVAEQMRPGDTEAQVAGRIAGLAVERGLLVDVLLVGADERPWRYRHCLPGPTAIRRHALMHLCCQKCGLHANPSRIVHFGPVEADLKRRHAAVSYVFADVLSRLKPEMRFGELLDHIKIAYADSGFAGEWEGHFQGGPAGYEACEPFMLLDSEARTVANQYYDWLFSLPGTKTEEMCLLTEDGVELMTLGCRWPTLRVEAGGKTFTLPDILVK